MRAAIYCRVSTEDQGREGTSLDSQLKACQDKAQELGYEISEEYTVRETYSGLSLDRPKLDQLRQWVRDKEIDFIGSDKEFFEFILRFSLSQFLSFWQGPMLQMLITIKDLENVKLKELNDQLKIWDYTKIFS